MSDDVAAVSGTRRQIKELVDGTLRVQIDIEPIHKGAFLKLFPEIDVPVALAPLRAVAIPPQQEPPTTLKGGPLATLAGRWCNEAAFHAWLQNHQPVAWNAAKESVDGDEHGLSGIAAQAIRMICGVHSRAQLDHDVHAKATFNRAIREPYRAFLGVEG